jgi:putative heme-binding domain-containing protein
MECGRIYRVVSKTLASEKFADVRASAEELDAENGWRRDTAFRLLFEEPSKVDLNAIREVARSGKRPQGRAAAIALLASLGKLEWDQVQTALADADSNVRRLAVRFGERSLGQEGGNRESLRVQLRTLAEDPDPAVRFQVALSLVPAEQADMAALQKLALRNADDVWTRRAVMMAAGARSSELAARVLAECEKYPRALTGGVISLSIELLRAAAAQADEDAERKLVSQLLRADGPARVLQVPGLLVTAQAMSRRGRSVSAAVTRDELRSRWNAMLADLDRLALQADASAELRIQAIELLSFDPMQSSRLAQIVFADAPTAVRGAALSGWGRQASIDQWREVLERFRSESPGLRRVIIDQTLAQTERTALLLDQISSGAIKASEFDRTQADRLIKHPDEAIRKRAASLMGSGVTADRAQVLADYQPVLKLAGDPQRGREVFAKQCASCHRVGDLGVNVAPDISDSRVKSSAQILTDILQPNRAIDNNYIGYVVVTKDGQSLTGVLSAETVNSVTLKQAEGKTATLLRSEIETLQSTGVSLMPEGLEKNIPPESMADLVSFIKNWRYLDGKTPLGGNVDVGQVSP